MKVLMRLAARLSGVIIIGLDYWLYFNLPKVEGIEKYQLDIVFVLGLVGLGFAIISIFVPKMLFSELWSEY